MKNRGQFSIIAALLVAVVLIGTVIVTYSAIRDSPVQEHPDVLGAIDETNFAIKQILGFTVGYYCSVLQVTGNSSFATTRAVNYLHSGLVNIANMHPEWSPSFRIDDSELRTYWFTNTSYSTGNVAVTYNLTGLGIYGITYETSCMLAVQVESAISSNQTQLVVTKDEGEPLINLGKRNFKFYRYTYENSTWELIEPDTEPIAFANSTYTMDIPSGIDPYSYLIQVKDQRGLIVVASSFSRYTCTLTWNSTLAWAQNYVHNNTSDVDSSADKGTHSNFPAQQAGPDSINDTLTEQNTGCVNTTLINAESFEGSWPPSGWTETGRWNKESNQAYDGTWSADFDGSNPGRSGDLDTPDLDCSDATAIYISFYFREECSVDSEFRLRFWDGSMWNNIEDLGQGYSSGWHLWEMKVTDSQYFKSDFKVRWRANDVESNEHIYVDLVTVKKEIQGDDNYELDLEVQWTNTYYNGTNEELCIYGGTMGSEDIQVDVWNGSTWENLFTDLSSGWNNVSVSSYLDSTTFTIRFKGSDETSDTIQDNWKMDATLLHVWPTEDLYQLAQDATIVVALLQNGTMRWLGQNLQLTTQTKPIPPIPVKAIHVNQTVNGMNREVPFQIEDWASDYRIPLGLTNNASVFGNRHMLVFLANPNVSKVTIWWNGSDTTTQTPLAYTNNHFSYTFGDQQHPITINNGILELRIDFSGDGSFKAISTLGASTATAVLMRINQDTAHYGWSKPMYVVLNGTVRAVLHHEVEWDGGISGCPNVYAHIVLTLPANATYYTYQLRLMFLESQQPRTITDLCPIRLSPFLGGQPQTENGTLNGYPIVNTSGLFYNFSTSCWQHHWSQLISGSKGAGIMFTYVANKMLYHFDAIAGDKTGALNVASNTIELLPVASPLASVSFTSALDAIWYGAVVTFDGTTPIYEEQDGNKTGLWIIVEYPPTITVTTES